MSKRFEGRVAIVSGAAQGIGRAIAERLGEEGATVVAVDQNGKGAEAAAKACGGQSFAVQCDVGDPEQVAALHRKVAEKAGKLDIQVNAAAIVPFVKWDDLTFEEWRRIMRVNLDGMYLMCRAGSEMMRKNGYGRIVNICSNSIFAGTPNMATVPCQKARVRVIGSGVVAGSVMQAQQRVGLMPKHENARRRGGHFFVYVALRAGSIVFTPPRHARHGTRGLLRAR